MTEKLDIRGNHVYMSPEEIEKWWSILETEYNTHLRQYSVKLPKKGSSGALHLIFLKKHEGKLVHKDTISTFVNSVNPNAGKDQQVRHLSAKGWYILNKGDKLIREDKTVQSGFHMLVTTESPKPNFLWRAYKRAGRVSAQNFEQLKVVYDFRCATCGSLEGKPHFLDQNQRTKLQQGHMDPHKQLTLDNSIPQCQICNQAYKDDFVFNIKGRIIAVASAGPVLRAEEKVRAEIKNVLQ
jgi:hypothetical protein